MGRTPKKKASQNFNQDPNFNVDKIIYQSGDDIYSSEEGQAKLKLFASIRTDADLERLISNGSLTDFDIEQKLNYGGFVKFVSKAVNLEEKSNYINNLPYTQSDAIEYINGKNVLKKGISSLARYITHAGLSPCFYYDGKITKVKIHYADTPTPESEDSPDIEEVPFCGYLYPRDWYLKKKFAFLEKGEKVSILFVNLIMSNERLFLGEFEDEEFLFDAISGDQFKITTPSTGATFTPSQGIELNQNDCLFLKSDLDELLDLLVYQEKTEQEKLDHIDETSSLVILGAVWDLIKTKNYFRTQEELYNSLLDAYPSTNLISLSSLQKIFPEANAKFKTNKNNK